MQYLFISVLMIVIWSGNSVYGQTPTVGDCLGAIPVCQDVYYEPNIYSGTGNYPNEIPDCNPINCELCCPDNCLDGEWNSAWYIFTVQESGLLRFTIDPDIPSDDYDWAVFNLTDGREELAAMDSTSYVIDFEKIRINIFSRSVKITGITVKPDSAAMEEVKRSRLAKPLVDVSIPRIRIGSVDLIKALKGKEFSIGSIQVDDPDVTVYGPQGLFSGEKEKSSADGGLSDSIMETAIKQAKLGYFELNNGHIRYVDASRDKLVLETKQLYVRADGIFLHHPDGDTSAHVLDVGDIKLSLQSHMMDLPGKLYNLQTGKLEIGYKDQNIDLDSLKLIPAYSKERFGHVVGKQTDRFDVSVDHINISGIEFDSLLNKKIIIDNVLLKRPNADIYRDKRIPRDMTIFPKLYQTAVADIPMDLYVKSVNVSNAYVNYQEMVKGAAKPGT